ARCTDSGALTGSASISIIISPPNVNTPPVVAITAPSNGASAVFGSSMTFSGTANDAQSGNMNSSLVWTSSLQSPSQIGTGASFSVSNLVAGTHTITARCTDSGALTGSAAITITITPPITNTAP